MQLIAMLLVLLQAHADDNEREVQVMPPAPPEFEARELTLLEEGGVVFRHVPGAEGRVTGLAAALSDAPPEVVWRHVLDFDSYVEFLPYITASRLHKEESNERRLICTLELTTLGVVTRYRMENDWHPEEGYLEWVLSPVSGNPFRGAGGHWLVTPFRGKTLMAYQTEVTMSWWVPGFLQVRAADRGLPTLVGLIRARAEAGDDDT